MKKFIHILLLMLTVSVCASVYVPRETHAQKISPQTINVRKMTLTAASGNNFTAGKVGFINSSGQVVLTNALNKGTSSGLLVMALGTVNGGASGNFRLLSGDYTTSGLTPGATYYLSETSGDLTATAPTTAGAIKREVGVALSSTVLIFGPINSVVSSTGTPDPVDPEVLPEAIGPYSFLNDGSPNAGAIKHTLPIACNGSFVGAACEIFPRNSVSWSVGDPDLDLYQHSTYLIRDADKFTYCSPNTGATTATASNGRSENRFLWNWTTGTIGRQFIFRIPATGAGGMYNLAKANIGQIHRNPGSPIFKGTYTHKADGTGIYRILTKKTDGAGDFAFDIGLGDKEILENLEAGDYVRVRYQYNIGTQELKFWASNDNGTKVTTTLTGTPLVTLTGVVMDVPGGVYEKLGIYMNDDGDGAPTDNQCVEIYQAVWTG